MNAKPIEWRKIDGWPYLVSESGEIIRIGSRRKLKPYFRGQYLCVRLFSLIPDTKPLQINVHKVVAQAFIGERPAGLTINHIDGQKLNNHRSNLEYVTRGENSRHASRLGLMPFGLRNGQHTHPEKRPRGERLGLSRLTDAAVIEVRSMPRETRPTWAELGRRFRRPPQDNPTSRARLHVDAFTVHGKGELDQTMKIESDAENWMVNLAHFVRGRSYEIGGFLMFLAFIGLIYITMLLVEGQ